ncbi:hypothetical protein L1049_007777 [Liquidambar formosana]|uniref:Homeobox domain-containing protein n=1 Tax=Liquidambar formosana TaxID=63359 RepID=A0AAP0S4W9_LIQFO
MELALSLGDASKPFSFLDKTPKIVNKDLGFCMGLRLDGISKGKGDEDERRASSDPPVQLDLLPFSPVPRQPHPSSQIRLPWLTSNFRSESGASDGPGKGFDVNRLPAMAVAAAEEEAEDGAALSSPNSTVSSFQMDFCMYRSGSGSGSGGRNKRDMEASGNEGEMERGCSRGSDDEENGLTRKKLRLSKEQSAFLEESFKEHNTLNPKQKLALAKQLNLRPRQVEVWFQNRRARTKLKQTEVDCEYLKRCCETLTEENRRLQKELQELRALKTSQPFYMQLPATTLTMCPSCERVATTTSTSSPAATNPTTTNNSSAALTLGRNRLFPFSHTQTQAQAHQSAS